VPDQVLRTARLTLEPLEVRHAAPLLEVLSAPEIYLHLDEDPPADLAALEARYRLLETRSSPDGRQEWLNWVVRVHGSGQPIGYVQATVEEGTAEIAYVLAPSWWGRGLATEAVTVMCAHLAVDHAVTRLTAHVAPANRASRSLLERLGFSFVRRTADGDLFLERTVERPA
jgi:ribosomal-protein-alanine N-acetyltransferase